MKQKTIDTIQKGIEPIAKKHHLIKSIYVAGSAVRKQNVKGSDIDVTIIVDDTRKDFSNAAISQIEAEFSALKKQMMDKHKLDLHFQPPKQLSLFWDLVRSGEPWVFTELRDALPIYDPSGYVTPLQILLHQGRLSGTKEKAHSLIERASDRMKSARRIFLEEVTTDFLNAMVESAQAVLMFSGVAPPGAKDIGKAFEPFAEKGLIPKKIIRDYNDFYNMTKKIDHGELTEFSGKDIDRHLSDVLEFVETMEKLFSVLENVKKRELVESAHKKAFGSCRNALERACGKAPKSDKEMIANFKKHFVDTGLVAKEHFALLQKINMHKSALDKGKLKEIPERDIYSSGVYARNIELVLGEIINEQCRKKQKSGTRKKAD